MQYLKVFAQLTQSPIDYRAMPPAFMPSGFFPHMTGTLRSAVEAGTTIQPVCANEDLMKRALLCILLLTFPVLLSAQSHPRQQGTIIRMRMTECMGPQHGFMAAMSGGAKMEPALLCPEYVLVADTVVYVFIGKTSEQLLPLAETTRFRFQKNEMLIRVDDAPKESHFRIKAMMMRPEWDRNQQMEEAAAVAVARHHLETAGLSDAPQ